MMTTASLFFSDVTNAPNVKRLFRPIKGGSASPVKSILSCTLKPTPSNSHEIVSVPSGGCNLSGVIVRILCATRMETPGGQEASLNISEPTTEPDTPNKYAEKEESLNALG